MQREITADREKHFNAPTTAELDTFRSDFFKFDVERKFETHQVVQRTPRVLQRSIFTHKLFESRFSLKTIMC